MFKSESLMQCAQWFYHQYNTANKSFLIYSINIIPSPSTTFLCAFISFLSYHGIHSLYYLSPFQKVSHCVNITTHKHPKGHS